MAMVLPISTMNVFKLPAEIYEEINKILAGFWWSKSQGRRMQWLSWDRLSNCKGGMGFKIYIFSALLYWQNKRVWRIMQTPNSLVARILGGCYFPQQSILNASLRNKPAYCWRSLMERVNLTQRGMGVLIGDGQETWVWQDSWLPTNSPFPPRSNPGV